MQTWSIHVGSAIDILATLPAASAHAIVTSPPYFGLRDYGVDGQIGLEPSPGEFVAALVAVFAEARRVLRDDGVLFVNLGDSYTGGPQSSKSGWKYGSMGSYSDAGRGSPVARRGEGLKPKDLIGIPWSVAFALRADGWYLRSDIIWHKPNPMPESVTDRPTKAHEYVFLLSKSARYYYNADAIREKYAESTLKQFQDPYDGAATKDYESAGVQNPSALKARMVAKAKQDGHGNRRYTGFNDRWDESMPHRDAIRGSNARTVWPIPTQPSPFDHFAVMPTLLARRCILAGCPPGGTVLDPFSGMATTGAVALEEGRSYIGIELNPKYAEASRARLAGVAPLLAREDR